MDRRQEKTRNAIFQGFLALLEKKSYDAITVQEIIDGANIGRSTFYAHFETKDTLLKAMCKDIFDHVFSEALYEETTHNFSAHGDFREKLIHILYHLQDNGKQMERILSCKSEEIFMAYLKEYLSRVFAEHPETIDRPIPKTYVIHHMVTSFAETVHWWLGENRTYTPEEIADFYLAVVPIAQSPNRL